MVRTVDTQRSQLKLEMIKRDPVISLSLAPSLAGQGRGILCVLCSPEAEVRLQFWSEDIAVPELLPVSRSFIPSETRGLFFLCLRHPGRRKFQRPC